MLSLILYGRNDSYGYNLHKRAAISLNCMAEVLTDPEDEIIFVDYNTPDDFPTFPEAIQDTLTDRAKKLLRILRVRSTQHERFRNRTKLVALEPIARNVAIRRSNPANRWILSTNTDMVFVPRRGRMLSEVARDLENNYYHLPRFEVPETLWESANRLNPTETIAAFEAWGREFHLNEIVFASDPMVRYDAPGDFQLALRSDLWRIHGFNEQMLLGWHVDSNVAKRLALLPYRIGDIVSDFFGYHCDHTRQVTPMHGPHATENDLQTFFEDVTSPQLPEQAETWGLAGEVIEELKVDATSRSYLAAVHSQNISVSAETTQLFYSGEMYNRIDYDPEHVLPFLADIFASYPRATVIGWFGTKKSLLRRFASTWKAMGFIESILISDTSSLLGPDLPEGCASAADSEISERSDVFVFDWGMGDDQSATSWQFEIDPDISAVVSGFRRMVREEQIRKTDRVGALRRFVGVNAINNEAERMFSERIGAARTPIATRIRQGYIIERIKIRDLLPQLNAGSAGRKAAGAIETYAGTNGYIFYGPYLDLDGYGYRLKVECDSLGTGDSYDTGFVLAVLSGGYLLDYKVVAPRELKAGAFSIEFHTVTKIGDAQGWPKVEFRLLTTGRFEVTIRRVLLEDAELPSREQPISFDFDCLPLLNIGPAASPTRVRSGPALEAKSGIADFMAYGPYIWLLPGRYEATFEFDSERVEYGASVKVEVATDLGIRTLARGRVEMSSGRRWFDRVFHRTRVRVKCVLAFDIRDPAPPHYKGLLEFRIWSPGTMACMLTALWVRRTGEAVELRMENGDSPHSNDRIPSELLESLRVGSAGRSIRGAIAGIRGIAGFAAWGPYIVLPPGKYEVTFVLLARRAIRGATLRLDVVAGLGSQTLAERAVESLWRGRKFEGIFGRRRGRLECCLSFEVSTEAANDALPIEFRVWSPGTIDFLLIGVRLRQVERTVSQDAGAITAP
jgi:hypothetical protein